MAVSFIDGGIHSPEKTINLPQVTDKLYHIINVVWSPEIENALLRHQIYKLTVNNSATWTCTSQILLEIGTCHSLLVQYDTYSRKE